MAEKLILQDLTPKLLEYFLTIEGDQVIKGHIQIEIDRLLLEIDYLLHPPYKLAQNYPNPFNSVTTINFQLPLASNLTLVIYDIQGREVVRLVDRYVEAGYYNIIWYAGSAASGVYLYRIQAGTFSDTKRMLFIK